MKRLTKTLLALTFLTTSLQASEDNNLKAALEEMNDYYRTGRGCEDVYFNSISTSMLAWGIGLFAGIALLTGLVYQSTGKTTTTDTNWFLAKKKASRRIFNMKRFYILLTLLSLSFSPFAHAQESDFTDEDTFFTDEDDELFNRGKFVGQESDEWLKARRFERNKNWAIAITTTALGVATGVLVGQQHKKAQNHAH